MKIAKIFYTLGWSVGLFFGTFWINIHSQSELMKLDITSMSVENANTLYIFPMIMVILLFMWDTIYSSIIARKNNEKPSVEIILLCMCFIFGGFLLTLMSSLMWLNIIGFCITWVTLTIMKLYCVYIISKDDEIQYANNPQINTF